MSLLMEALKKAEQEKRDAAKKLIVSDEELSVTRRESIGDITDSHLITGATDPVPAVDPETTQESPADRTYQTMSLDLALEPLDASQQNPLLPKRSAGILAIEERESAGNDADTTHSVTGEMLTLETSQNISAADLAIDPDKTHQVELPATSVAQADPDQTFHGVNLDQQAVPGLYDDTIQGEPFKPGDLNHSYDETLPGVPAAQLARDIGTQDQPTPVAAQTLFTATGTVAKHSSGFRWLLISLCVLAVGSAAVFYYFTTTPVSRNIPSPMVARGVETIIPSQELQTTVAGTPAVTPAPAEPAIPQDSAVEPATPAPVEQATETPVDAQAVASNGEPAPEPEPAAVATEDPAPAALATATPAEPANLPAVIEPPASLIRISRNVAPADEGVLIGEAFRAWQQGDYELARMKYMQANEQAPDNRDVLLGLAAVATRTGDMLQALQLYLRLVEMNPLDSVARAALISLQPGNDIVSSISAIKSMLADNPEQPSLHFTLGRLYAAQSNWASAQQAFFDAYRLDSANADYAYNLAVSLDRLDQSQSALDYYTVALGLADSGPAGFNRTAAADRIRTLEAGN